MRNIEKDLIVRSSQKVKMTNDKKQKPLTIKRNIEHDDHPENEKMEKFPWQRVNSDEKRLLSLYLPKDVHEKLRFLSEETDVAQQKIMRKVLVPEIERQVDELVKNRE